MSRTLTGVRAVQTLPTPRVHFSYKGNGLETNRQKTKGFLIGDRPEDSKKALYLKIFTDF